MSVVHSRSKAIHDLAQALGIEKNCTGFTLVCKPDNIVRLHVTYALQDDQAIRMVDVFKKYKMEEVDESSEAQELGEQQ